MKTLTITGSLCLLSILACTACESIPRGPDPQTQPVEYGEWMYERKCQQCHELYDPAEFTQRSLRRALKRYAPQAGLQREDRPYVERYLLRNARDAQGDDK